MTIETDMMTGRCTITETGMMSETDGYQPEKLQARQYLLLYTVLASLPLLLSLVHIPRFLCWLAPGASLCLGVALTLGFIVKRPLYLVHIWLPK